MSLLGKALNGLLGGERRVELPQFIVHVARSNIPKEIKVGGGKTYRVEALPHPENPAYKIYRTPLRRAEFVETGSKYTRGKLRALRAERGVGRPPEALLRAAAKLQANRPGASGGEFGL